MFKLAPEETFPLSVEIPFPGGKTKPLALTMKWLSRDDLHAYCDAGRDHGDVEFIGGLIVGWEADKPYNADSLADLFRFYPKAARAIFRAYCHELLGIEEKNS